MRRRRRSRSRRRSRLTPHASQSEQLQPPRAQRLAPPAARCRYDRGYPLGFIGSADRPGSVEGTAYLYNHLRFVIKFHKEDSFVGARVVGFEVEPLSVKHQYKGKFTTDMANLNLLTVPVGPDLPPQPVVIGKKDAAPAEVVYTYDVKWEYSPVKWASRWDLYLYMGDDQIHWFSIINSLAIVLLLTGIVAMIMMRTLRRDFNRYNEQDKEDLQEESGWKLARRCRLEHAVSNTRPESRPAHAPWPACLAVPSHARHTQQRRK